LIIKEFGEFVRSQNSPFIEKNFDSFFLHHYNKEIAFLTEYTFNKNSKEPVHLLISLRHISLEMEDPDEWPVYDPSIG
jgi:hypothetical protein